MTFDSLTPIGVEEPLGNIHVHTARPEAGKMQGRNEPRASERFLLHISSVHDPFLTEVASVENISSNGVRVATERSWELGSHVNVRGYDLKARARVVYCRATGPDKFAVGLNIIRTFD